jgi:hypothetical protein
MDILLPALGIGFVVGFRHAFEPDHLAAVTTLATTEGGMSHAARLGVAWGVGHTASVAVVAVALIVLGIRVPERFYAVAELGVAALLITLGIGTLLVEARRHRRALGVPHAAAHEHHHPHRHPAPLRTASRALGFGLAHGLAGSGAVVVLLVAASPHPRTQFSYLVAFGIGTIVGMSLVSFLTGRATGAVARRHTAVARYVRLGAAGVSAVIGVMLGAEVISRI